MNRTTWLTCRWPACRSRSRRTPRWPACRPGTAPRRRARPSPRRTTRWYADSAAPVPSWWPPAGCPSSGSGGPRTTRPRSPATRGVPIGPPAARPAAAGLLVPAGQDAVGASPRSPPGLGRRGMATWFAAAYRDVELAGGDRALLHPRTRRHVAIGEWAWRRGLVRERDRTGWRTYCEQWFAQGHDVLLTPALAAPPPPAADWHARPWRGHLLAPPRAAPLPAP